MSDSLSWLDGGSGDGAFAGAVWRPPPGKRGAFLHARLVETGGRGVRVRRLGASRAGEIRLTRFLRNPAVTVEEMAAEAAARTAARCAGRAVVAIQDTPVVPSQGGGGLYLHAVLAVDEGDGAILGLMHACFLARDAGRRSARGSRPLAEKESRRWLDGAGRAAEVGAKAARVTVIADRESDIFAAFALRPAATELVVRAGLSGILCAGPVDHHARMNLSSKMMANWVFASPHSRGDIFRRRTADHLSRKGRRSRRGGAQHVRCRPVGAQIPRDCPELAAQLGPGHPVLCVPRRGPADHLHHQRNRSLEREAASRRKNARPFSQP